MSRLRGRRNSDACVPNEQKAHVLKAVAPSISQETTANEQMRSCFRTDPAVESYW